VEIAIMGEGELVIRFIDRAGQTLMQERLVASGSPSLRTVNGTALVAPVLVHQSDPKQRVTFDGQTLARFTRKRCKEIGCAGKIAGAAARGDAPPPVPGQGPSFASGDPSLERLIASARRSTRRGARGAAKK